MLHQRHARRIATAGDDVAIGRGLVPHERLGRRPEGLDRGVGLDDRPHTGVDILTLGRRCSALT